MRPLSWLFCLAAVQTACEAAIPRDAEPAAQLLPPTEDPWYTAPMDFESKAPGDILHVRTAPGNLTSVAGNASAAYNILYRTADARDQPSWAVTTLLIPETSYVSPFSNVAFLLGVTAQFPDARAYLEGRLRAETKDEFLSVRDINVADAWEVFAGKDIYTYFKGGESDLRAPILTELYETQAKLGVRGVPDMPTFVYKAVYDEYCPID